MKIIIDKNMDMLAKNAATLIVDSIKAVAEKKDKVVLGLVGGRSVVSTYDELAKIDSPAWIKTHFIVLDERAVPSDSDESNFKLIKKHLLNPLIERNQIDIHNIHPFDSDKANIEEAISDYTRILIADGDKIDVAILSSGEDGHIAAIYPGKNYDNDKHFIYMEDSPKPPSKRITATPKVISSSCEGFVFFLGEAKKTALKEFLGGARSTPMDTERKIEKLTILTDQK